MRSNDLVWGLPYDVFFFTMLQELLAQKLGLDLGVYIHGAGSLHLYERHTALARRVLSEAQPSSVPMEEMKPLSGIHNFLAAERAIRVGGTWPSLPRYWADLANVLVEFSERQSTK
jgi:thymidylate synthase